MGTLHMHREGFLLSGTLTSGGGTPMDTRAAANFAALQYVTYAPSALVAFEMSFDSTGWNRVLLLTGTTTTGTAQISAYYPYVRGVYVTGWSTTASAVMRYAAGVT